MNWAKIFIKKHFDEDTIKQFYYPFKYNKIKLRFLKSKFKFLGKRSYIDFPVRIEGIENVYVGDDVVINSFVHIWGRGGVHIGDRVLIAAHTAITSLTHDYTHECMRFAPIIASPIIIEDDVWIGSNVVIMPGIKIGEGSVIGAGSIVTKNIPPFCIAVGNPAKVIKQRIIK